MKLEESIQYIQFIIHHLMNILTCKIVLERHWKDKEEIIKSLPYLKCIKKALRFLCFRELNNKIKLAVLHRFN
jgi:hypothetical protein